MFDYEWRGAAPTYAGRHRKGWLAAIGGWRRGNRQRVRARRDLSGSSAAEPDQRELQMAGRTHRSQAR
jgi:hypothetical protein